MDLSGFLTAISADLADAAGAKPELLVDPNATVTMRPGTTAGGAVTYRVWTGECGSVNSHGCAVGTLPTIQGRMLYYPEHGNSVKVSAYALFLLTSGACSYLRFFLSGARSLFDAAQSHDLLDNRLGLGTIDAGPFERVLGGCRLYAE